MDFDDEQGALYREILDFLSLPDGTAISSAALQKELDRDREAIEAAVRDLIAFGELELVNVSQYARVRPRRQVVSEVAQQAYVSPPDELDWTWHAYITERDGTGRTRARRLYEDRDAATAHLRQLAHFDSLVAVPNVDGVWCGTTTGAESYKQEYAVLRREPIFKEAVDPHS